MTLHVALHSPTRASAVTFESKGRTLGRVKFACADGQVVEIYTTPDAAEAIASAFNGARKYASPVADEEREGTA